MRYLVALLLVACTPNPWTTGSPRFPRSAVPIAVEGDVGGLSDAVTYC